MKTEIQQAQVEGIRTALGKSVEAILEAGKLIWEFKQSFPQAQGGSEFSTIMKSEFNMSPPTSSRWASIGENYEKGFSLMKKLPQSYSSIAQILSLPDLAQAEKEGIINPAITQLELEAYKRRLKLEKIKEIEDKKPKETKEPKKPKQEKIYEPQPSLSDISMENRRVAIKELGISDWMLLSAGNLWPKDLVALIKKRSAKKYHPDKGATHKQALRFDALIKSLLTDYEDEEL